MTTGTTPGGRTWRLEHRGLRTVIEIALTVDAVLTVTITAPGKPTRTDSKKLTSFIGAVDYVARFIAERVARGFVVVVDSFNDELRARWQREAEERAQTLAAIPATAAMHPGAAWRTAAAVERAGFVAVNAVAIPHDELAAILNDGTQVLQVIVDNDEHNDGSERAFLEALACTPRPGLSGLVLDTHWQTPARQTDPEYGAQWGNLTPVLAALPSLKRAFVVGAFTFTGGHASLQDLQLVAREPFLSSAITALRTKPWPQLRSLGVGAGGEDRHSRDDLVRLLSSAALPTLQRLCVSGVGDALAVLEAAATRTGWQSIAIDGGFADDEDRVVARLLTLAPRFAHVDVHLSLADACSTDAVAAVHAAWPALRPQAPGLFLPATYTANTDDA